MEPGGQAALLPEERKTRENLVVLYITQAMLGLISPSVRAVAVDACRDRLMVHFAVKDDSTQLREDIEDILGDLDALLYNERIPDEWTISHEVHVGAPDEHWPGCHARRVFEVKVP